MSVIIPSGFVPSINPPTVQHCKVFRAWACAAGNVGGRAGAAKICVGADGDGNYVGADGSASVIDNNEAICLLAPACSTTGAIC